MPTPRRMYGLVESKSGNYFVVVCPDAPPHLTILHLIKSQMGGAAVGDGVELEYQSNASYGLWNVIRVLDK